MENSLNIYLISQDENNGYDTYDSAVVVAENEGEARKISPSDYYKWRDGAWWFQYADGTEEKSGPDFWASSPEKVSVELLGIAVEGIASGTIICSSFNAG